MLLDSGLHGHHAWLSQHYKYIAILYIPHFQVGGQLFEEYTLASSLHVDQLGAICSSYLFQPIAPSTRFRLMSFDSPVKTAKDLMKSQAFLAMLKQV